MGQIITEDKEINTPFPTLQWKKYLKKLDLNNKKLVVKDAEHIFVLAIEDFRNGPLSLDGLADVCGYLFHEVITTSKDPNVISSKLGDILLQVADLSYDIRHGTDVSGYLKEAYDLQEKLK